MSSTGTWDQPLVTSGWVTKSSQNLILYNSGVCDEDGTLKDLAYRLIFLVFLVLRLLFWGLFHGCDLKIYFFPVNLTRLELTQPEEKDRDGELFNPAFVMPVFIVAVN